MSTASLDRLDLAYESIQRHWPVTNGPSELAQAVQFGPNRNKPVHRWFHFKEGFSADLFSVIGVDTALLSDRDSVFLDPFCGSGTTVVAGDIECGWPAVRIGVEINPFLAFVAQTKAAWRRNSPTLFARLASELLDAPLCEDLSESDWPALSTFHNHQMLERERISALVDMVRRLRSLPQIERDLLLLGVAATAEKVSFYRKDGRALRLLRTPSELDERRRLDVRTALQRTWSLYEADLRTLYAQRRAAPGPCFICQADGRTLRLEQDLPVRPGGVSLIAYSPPYLNHIDYTEVYKVELWLLQYVSSQQEMLDLRKQTLRSHGSIAVETTQPSLPMNVARALEIATDAITTTGKQWHRRFGDLARAYLTDLNQTLTRQHELLRPGGRAVCVVANSAHGSSQMRVPIATDLFIAALAECAGLEVERFLIARQLRRRDHLNRFLRETVLVFRRPLNC